MAQRNSSFSSAAQGCHRVGHPCKKSKSKMQSGLLFTSLLLNTALPLLGNSGTVIFSLSLLQRCVIRGIFNIKTSGVCRHSHPYHNSPRTAACVLRCALVRDPHPETPGHRPPQCMALQGLPTWPFWLLLVLDMTEPASGKCNTPSKTGTVYKL